MDNFETFNEGIHFIFSAYKIAGVFMLGNLLESKGYLNIDTFLIARENKNKEKLNLNNLEKYFELKEENNFKRFAIFHGGAKRENMNIIHELINLPENKDGKYIKYILFLKNEVIE